MLDFTRRLTVPSAVAYGAWRLRKSTQAISLTFREGTRFELRPGRESNNDYGVAYEIFVERLYDDGGSIAREPVRLIVDLGVNVGYSLLFWLKEFPNARAIGFEPHPAHIQQARRNLEINGYLDRVALNQAAAGASNRRMRLTNKRSASTVTELELDGTFGIDMVDIFPLLLGRKIDVFKIDIEGGEYEILGDPRFEELNIDNLVMEWHGREDPDADRKWCETRMESRGYRLREIFRERKYGMFWALSK